MGTTILKTLLLCALCGLALVQPVLGWSNGGFSTSSSAPVYGTHDWIAQHALDWLPAPEKQYIQDNLAAYLYGTELPDNNAAPDHIGDTTKHHIYFWSNGSLQDDASAVRASSEFQVALNYLNQQDYADAAKAAGIMSHYIADVGVFAHVMGASTDWGAETGNNHSNYESYINGRTSSYNDEFNRYLSFDGTLSAVSACDAAKSLGYDTTFDHGARYTCVWMNNNYNVSNPTYWNRAGESLNLAINYVTDVLHTLYLTSNSEASSTPTRAPTPTSTAMSSPTLDPTPTQTPTPTPTPSTPLTPTQKPTSTLNPTPTPSQTISPISTPSIPEFSAFMATSLVIAAILLSIMFIRKRAAINNH